MGRMQTILGAAKLLKVGKKANRERGGATRRAFSFVREAALEI